MVLRDWSRLRTIGVQTCTAKKNSQSMYACERNFVCSSAYTLFALHFRSKVSRYFIQWLAATNFIECSKNQMTYDTTEILHDLTISTVTVLNNLITAPGLCTPGVSKLFAREPHKLLQNMSRTGLLTGTCHILPKQQIFRQHSFFITDKMASRPLADEMASRAVFGLGAVVWRPMMYTNKKNTKYVSSIRAIHISCNLRKKKGETRFIFYFWRISWPDFQSILSFQHLSLNVLLAKQIVVFWFVLYYTDEDLQWV